MTALPDDRAPVLDVTAPSGVTPASAEPDCLAASSACAVGLANGSCAPVAGEGQVPLAALLARLEAAFIAEFEARLRDSPFCALSLAHSRNVLRHLGAGPRRASQIVALADVSKQALSQQIAHLERNGYLRSEPDPADSRARMLVLTDRGQAAQAHAKATFAQIEADWAERVPDGGMVHLRELLLTLIFALGPDATRVSAGAPGSADRSQC